MVVPWAWSMHTTPCPLQVLQVLHVISLGLETSHNKKHYKQAPKFKGCYLIPIFNKQNVIWRQKLRKLEDSKV